MKIRNQDSRRSGSKASADLGRHVSAVDLNLDSNGQEGQQVATTLKT
ncbi:MAG: hypothetical protein AB2705_22700 [Candidatus Thiodiazotropha sp.]